MYLSWLLYGTAGACTLSGASSISLGEISSFDARTAQQGAGSGAGGLVCPGILGLLTYQYVYVSVSAADTVLTHGISDDTIPFTLTTVPSGTPLTAGTMSDNLAASGLLSLAGPSGEILMFVNRGSAANLTAGTYRGTIDLRWY